MCLRSGEHEVVTLALPGWRHQHRAIDTCRVHFVEQIVFGDGLRAMRLVPCRPWTLGRVRGPDVYL